MFNFFLFIDLINPPVDKMKNKIGGNQLLGLMYIVIIVPISTIKKTVDLI